jgi:predicted dehydrogenase
MKTDNSCITWLFLVLTVLISDDAEKRDKLGKEYHLKSYSYDQFSQALEDGECDAFYIATPNNQHRKFAAPALEKGSYIIHKKKTYRFCLIIACTICFI